MNKVERAQRQKLRETVETYFDGAIEHVRCVNTHAARTYRLLEGTEKDAAYKVAHELQDHLSKRIEDIKKSCLKKLDEL